ncbi:uncharacterized protein LOC34624406 [Cyclospora cayetanensis]|uniref:mRNA (guanine-N(7))-methyltransferase n=1 Tax=Cyclospora cayetanensis TaxID=88456 RepID=A0A6P6S142_9EIME|nr:uncharacterized protein LOC34624406 [Cyclospora cayetanensis]
MEESTDGGRGEASPVKTPLRGRARAIALARAKAEAAAAAAAAAAPAASFPAASAVGEDIQGAAVFTAAGEEPASGPFATARRLPAEFATAAGVLGGKLQPVLSLGCDEGVLEDEVAAFLEECCSSSNSSGEDLVVVGATGTLVGRYSKRPVSLPFATSCLLSSDTAQLLFDEGLPQQQQEQQLQHLLQQLLGAERRAYGARQLSSRIQIVDVLHESRASPAAAGEGVASDKSAGLRSEEEGSGDGVLQDKSLNSRKLIYSMQDDDDQPQQHQSPLCQHRRRERAVRVTQQVLLGQKLIYRPRALRHLQVSVFSETAHLLTPLRDSNAGGLARAGSSAAPPEEGGEGELPLQLASDLQRFGLIHEAAAAAAAAAAARVSERKIIRSESWLFSPFARAEQGSPQQGMVYPEWIVELRREIEEGDINSHPEVLLQQLQHAAAATSTGRGADADLHDESRRVSVRLYAPARCLQVQQQKQQHQQQHLLLQQPSVFSALVSLFLHNLRAAIAAPLEAAAAAAGTGASGTRTLPLYYPGALGDNQQAIQSFYENRKITVAAESPITALRLHNNQAKRMLIQMEVFLGARVLDLACGHAQDLLKFAQVRVSRLLGIDFSRDSILEARHRVRERSSDRLLQQLLTPPEYHVGNALEEKAWQYAAKEAFDIVSIQLAIHYMVPSQQQATDLLSRCAGRLVPGGKLIGSTMCCREIVRYVLDLKLLQQPSPDADETDEFVSVCLSRLDVAQGQRVFWAGNSLCALFFEEQTLAPLLHPFRLPTEEGTVYALTGVSPPLSVEHLLMNVDAVAKATRGLRIRDCVSGAAVSELALHLLEVFSTRFGIKYHFWLRTAIDAEEFVFPFKAVRNTAKELGLECCLSVSFPRLLDAAANHPKLGADARAWVRGLRSRRGALLDRQQAETFALYKAFSFRKIDPNSSNSSNNRMSGQLAALVRILYLRCNGPKRGEAAASEAAYSSSQFHVGSQEKSRAAALLAQGPGAVSHAAGRQQWQQCHWQREARGSSLECSVACEAKTTVRWSREAPHEGGEQQKHSQREGGQLAAAATGKQGLA